MTRARVNGRRKQQSAAPPGASLEQIETDTRPLLNRVRDSLTRRRPSRAYRSVEGRPPTPYAPYPNMEEEGNAESRHTVTARTGSERRRDNRQTEIAEPTPVRASTIPSIFRLSSPVASNARSAEGPESVDSVSQSGRFSAATSTRDGGQDRGPALLDHLTGPSLSWRMHGMRDRRGMEARGPFSGHNSVATTPPPPYIAPHFSHSAEDLAYMPPRLPHLCRATLSQLAGTTNGRGGTQAWASQARIPELTGHDGESDIVAAGLHSDSTQNVFSGIVAGHRVRIRWEGGHILRIWRLGVLVATVTVTDDMYAELSGAPPETKDSPAES